MNSDEIDLFAPLQLSTIDSEEQENAKQMIQDLLNFSNSELGEMILNTWEINFIDALSYTDIGCKPFTEKQIEKIDELHTKYLVDEDY